MQKVTNERDNINKNVIRNVFIWVDADRRHQLLTVRTPEERAYFVKVQEGILVICLLVLIAFVVIM